MEQVDFSNESSISSANLPTNVPRPKVMKNRHFQDIPISINKEDLDPVKIFENPFSTKHRKHTKRMQRKLKDIRQSKINILQ